MPGRFGQFLMKFTIAADQAPIGLLTTSSRGEIITVNRTLLNLLGYQSEQLESQSMTKLFSRSGKLFFLTHVLPMLQQQEVVEEVYLRLVDKALNEVPVLVNASVINEQGKSYCIFSMMPIQRRFIFEDQLVAAKKAAEQALEAERQAMTALSAARQELEDKQQQLLQLNEKLQRLAATDELTQLQNRRSFEEALEYHLAASKRQVQQVGVLLLDIDYFKRINDNFGHSCGDDVLRIMAELLKRLTREVDTVARIGGEEFAILLPGDNQQGAIDAAERIRQEIFAHSWPQEQAVSASFGVTIIKESDDREAVFNRADKALYRAKSNGRNRVESA